MNIENDSPAKKGDGHVDDGPAEVERVAKRDAQEGDLPGH